MATTAARTFKVTGAAPGPFPPNADNIQLSPDGQKAFVNLQGKHYLVTIPRPGKETVTINITAQRSVGSSRQEDVGGGRRLLDLVARWEIGDLVVGLEVLPSGCFNRQA